MGKRIYIGIFALILALLVSGLIYWHSQKVAVSPIESEISFEEEALEKDLAELEEFEKDKSLENLQEDLSEIAEEAAPEISDAIENLESEFSSELDSLASDLNDLESGFIKDTSLDTLESGLAGVAE